MGSLSPVDRNGRTWLTQSVGPNTGTAAGGGWKSP
jgi:hypothetical protein